MRYFNLALLGIKTSSIESQWQPVDYQPEGIPTEFGYLDANDDILGEQIRH